MRFHRHRPRTWATTALVVAAGLATTVLVPQAGAAARVEVTDEHNGADCAIPDPGSATANPLLPDPFA